MDSSCGLKFQFNGKEDAMKFCYVHKNVLVKGKKDEEKTGTKVEPLNTEAFECYFDRFTDKDTPTEEAKSFRKVKTALFEKFSSKKA